MSRDLLVLDGKRFSGGIAITVDGSSGDQLELVVGDSGGFRFQSVIVLEPTSFALLGVGGLTLLRRRRR